MQIKGKAGKAKKVRLKHRFNLKRMKEEIKIAKKVQERIRTRLKSAKQKSDTRFEKIKEDIKQDFLMNKKKMKQFGHNIKAFPQNLLEKKYAYEIATLELEKLKKEFKKKFVIVQIDALSYKTLKLAIDQGYCPFIKKLLKKKRYHLTNYNCGIPSWTPFVQAGIMYGDNSGIPNFRFIDKKKRKNYSHASSWHVKELEKMLYAKNKGILVEGASYMNHYSGDAKRNVLTMSKMNKKEYLSKLKGVKIARLVFLNPLAVLRTTFQFMREFFTDIAETIVYNIKAFFTGKTANMSFFLFPFRRTFTNVTFRQMITKGALLDLKRGVPRIYVNFNSYDELSHQRGPITRSAFVVLKDVDNSIRTIFKNKPEDYDFYLLSDHGQEDSVNFQKKYDQTLEKIIKKVANVKTIEYGDVYEEKYAFTVNVTQRLRQVAKTLSLPLRMIAKMIAQFISWGVGHVPLKLKWGSNKIFLQTADCLSGVYFTFTTEQANISEIDKRYPLLIPTLINHEGIEFVIGKEDNCTVVLSKHGRAVIDHGLTIFGKNILKKFGEPSKIARQLKYFMDLKNQGDLMLLGAFNNGISTSFTKHIGVHGGFGGEMCNAFFISKKKFDLSNVINSTALYKIFKAYSQ